MRVVFDTNVVLSGILWGGNPQRAFEAIVVGYAILLSDENLIHELQTVLSRPKFATRIALSGSSVEMLMQQYLSMIEIVTPVDIGQVVRDPKDDKFVACAVGGGADAIVSGDSDLLDMVTYDNIRMITVAVFLNEVDFAND